MVRFWRDGAWSARRLWRPESISRLSRKARAPWPGGGQRDRTGQDSGMACVCVDSGPAARYGWMERPQGGSSDDATAALGRVGGNETERGMGGPYLRWRRARRPALTEAKGSRMRCDMSLSKGGLRAWVGSWVVGEDRSECRAWEWERRAAGREGQTGQTHKKVVSYLKADNVGKDLQGTVANSPRYAPPACHWLRGWSD